MYLFRGDLGCMLYTGDFRWELGCEKARRAKQALLDALDGDTVDVLYLDNTYCHPSLNFPPRPVVAEQVSFAYSRDDFADLCLMIMTVYFAQSLGISQTANTLRNA
jgi:hypothetical protein